MRARTYSIQPWQRITEGSTTDEQEGSNNMKQGKAWLSKSMLPIEVFLRQPPTSGNRPILCLRIYVI